MHTIGSTIINLRQRKNWSQRHLAKELKVSTKTIKNWEADISAPSAEHIIHICRLFCISADYLLGISNCLVMDISSIEPHDRIKLNSIIQAYIDACKYSQTSTSDQSD